MNSKHLIFCVHDICCHVVVSRHALAIYTRMSRLQYFTFSEYTKTHARRALRPVSRERRSTWLQECLGWRPSARGWCSPKWSCAAYCRATAPTWRCPEVDRSATHTVMTPGLVRGPDTLLFSSCCEQAGPWEQTLGLLRYHKWILLSHATVDSAFLFRPPSWLLLTLARLKNMELVLWKINKSCLVATAVMSSSFHFYQ